MYAVGEQISVLFFLIDPATGQSTFGKTATDQHDIYNTEVCEL